MYNIEVNPPGGSYRVLIREGVLDQAGAWARSITASRKALMVSDTRVFGLYKERCLLSLKNSGWQVSVSLIRPGERSKTLSAAGRLYDRAIEAGLDRYSPVIALGGGVVGDLAGFVAATYMRGVPLLQIPTTLLAQVDSSVGGKTAVNHPRGKNLIGVFHQPSLVLADPAALKTLPLCQLRAGLAEVIKVAVIRNKAFFSWLEENLPRLLGGDSAALAEAIWRSVREKKEVVEQDERESGPRRLLNYGHTVGHALESATAYRYYLHGEAVLTGMSAAAEIARRKNLLDDASAGRIQALLEAVGFKRLPAGLTPDLLVEKISYDKKRRGDELLFVLPTGIGEADYEAPVSRTLLRQVLHSLLAGEGPFSGMRS